MAILSPEVRFVFFSLLVHPGPGKAALGALPLFLAQMVGRLRQVARARGRHPGTAEQRALCLNPVIHRQDYSACDE